MTRRTVVKVALVSLGVAALAAGVGAAAGAWGEDPQSPVAAATVSWEGVLTAPTAASTFAAPSADEPPAAEPTPVAPQPPAFDLARHPTGDPASPWVVVNKQHPVPAEYVPADLVDVAPGVQLRADVAPDLTAMIDAAAPAGARLGILSGYRSYQDQAATRAAIEARRGFEHAERYSARPGFSEHQTGLAVDLGSGTQPGCDLQSCFAQTAEGAWLAEHAWEFGFVVRYTEANTGVTGYAPEGWHLRWVGRDLAAYLHGAGVGSLEEAFGVPGGPVYAGG
ncbi:MAG: D-alanyl-D-alanine carboxypeptidase family protein [Cellulomonas iranensis]|uniref:M15 family metallopeptidase n=1 Tax=Cellulomonas iranensis TaxID=76862 RepID=UPI001B273351|nr:D-alanyl-D-alanine carboxypeptidase family protein [Cellulomonas iranensis]MBO9569040.1 D-alanyl-D-alanine carboxypeptidase family protein [Cellulomonas iranensis]